MIYSDNSIVKLGRWQDTGLGIWSGWGGSQLRFNISGSTSLTVNANVVCAIGKLCICECVIDNNPQPSLIQYFANNENFTGARSVTFTLPDTGSHEICIKTNGYNGDIFNGLSKVTITSIDGAISAPKLGKKLIQCVGDSWMAADNDWPRLMDDNFWNTYQIATGGLTAANVNSQYNYDSSGVSASDDISDAVVTGFGVNEYNQNITVSSFQTFMLALVDKIQAKQSCPIFLVQCPRNGSLNYDQYGSAMSNIAGLRSNVTYISTADIWSQVTWLSDNAHLDANGKVILANYINDKILSTIGYTLPYLRMQGEVYTGCNVVTDSHALRYKGSEYLGFKLDNFNGDPLRIKSGSKYSIIGG